MDLLAFKGQKWGNGRHWWLQLGLEIFCMHIVILERILRYLFRRTFLSLRSALVNVRCTDLD